MQVLFVCTGNMCRSPFAQIYSQKWARQHRSDLEFQSAGLGAEDDRLVHPLTAIVIEEFGLDADDFRSRQFSASAAARSELILTFTRDQRTSVLARVPSALSRTYTLKEAAALAPHISGIGDLPRARLERRDAIGELDIADPVDEPLDFAREIMRQIAADLSVLLPRIA